VILAAAAEAESMNPWIKALFILVGIGLVMPAILTALRAGAFNQRQRNYDRQRAAVIRRRTKNGGMGHRRYNHLWVVDRDLYDQDKDET